MTLEFDSDEEFSDFQTEMDLIKLPNEFSNPANSGEVNRVEA